MTFGELVRKLRERKGYSYRELANISGVSSSALHRLEHDRIEPTITTLRFLAAALGANEQKLILEYLKLTEVRLPK